MGAEFGYRLHTGPNGELVLVSQHDSRVVLCSAYATTGLQLTTEHADYRYLDDPGALHSVPTRQYVELQIQSHGHVQFLNELPPHFTNPLASFTTEALLAELYDRMEQRRIALHPPLLSTSHEHHHLWRCQLLRL